jgi:hypothetical protein
VKEAGKNIVAEQEIENLEKNQQICSEILDYNAL